MPESATKDERLRIAGERRKTVPVETPQPPVPPIIETEKEAGRVRRPQTRLPPEEVLKEHPIKGFPEDDGLTPTETSAGDESRGDVYSRRTFVFDRLPKAIAALAFGTLNLSSCSKASDRRGTVRQAVPSDTEIREYLRDPELAAFARKNPVEQIIELKKDLRRVIESHNRLYSGPDDIALTSIYVIEKSDSSIVNPPFGKITRRGGLGWMTADPMVTRNGNAQAGIDYLTSMIDFADDYTQLTDNVLRPLERYAAKADILRRSLRGWQEIRDDGALRDALSGVSGRGLRFDDAEFGRLKTTELGYSLTKLGTAIRDIAETPSVAKVNQVVHWANQHYGTVRRLKDLDLWSKLQLKMTKDGAQLGLECDRRYGRVSRYHQGVIALPGVWNLVTRPDDFMTIEMLYSNMNTMGGSIFSYGNFEEVVVPRGPTGNYVTGKPVGNRNHFEEVIDVSRVTPEDAASSVKSTAVVAAPDDGVLYLLDPEVRGFYGGVMQQVRPDFRGEAAEIFEEALKSDYNMSYVNYVFGKFREWQGGANLARCINSYLEQNRGKPFNEKYNGLLENIFPTTPIAIWFRGRPNDRFDPRLLALADQLQGTDEEKMTQAQAMVLAGAWKPRTPKNLGRGPADLIDHLDSGVAGCEGYTALVVATLWASGVGGASPMCVTRDGRDFSHWMGGMKIGDRLYQVDGEGGGGHPAILYEDLVSAYKEREPNADEVYYYSLHKRTLSAWTWSEVRIMNNQWPNCRRLVNELPYYRSTN